MTIDIGFAYIDLPKAGRVSIVDVPGHEKFISNMLVGAQGVDVALLCVAADESVMPQTREHLQILELLPVEKVVVALTRADLADEDMAGLVRDEVAELMSKSRFESAPIVATSAKTGAGLDALRFALDDALEGQEAKISGPWMMPIDRVFSVKGHGVVVTGTLASGQVKVGDEAEILPGNLKARVRSLQSHDVALESSERGRRTAMNLSGVRTEDVHRGMMIGAPGVIQTTSCLDAKLNLVGELKHAARIRVSIGTEEAIGKAFLSVTDPNFVQLRLESEIACAVGQPVIVRRYSPPTLLGGGTVVTPVAVKRRRSEGVGVTVTADDAQTAILEVVASSPGGVNTEEICRRLGRSAQALGDTFEQLLKDQKLIGFAGLWLTQETLDAAYTQLESALMKLHTAHPAVSYIPRERAISDAKLKWTGKPLDRAIAHLAASGRLVVQGAGIRLASHIVSLNDKQRRLLDRVLSELNVNGVNVPSLTDVSKSLSVPIQAVEEIVRLGTETGEVARVDEGLYYPTTRLAAIKADMAEAFGDRPFTASECRDKWQSSRKYVIPILEYFDAKGVTLRMGDARVMRGER